MEAFKLIVFLFGNLNMVEILTQGRKYKSKMKECIQENIALLKNTTQSSTYLLHTHDGVTPLSSMYANDGNLYQKIDADMKMFCSHTLNNETNNNTHWWMVDLGCIYTIRSIRIYNRKDCCGERLREFSIFVYNPVIPSWATYNSGEEILCYSHEGRSPDILNVSCNRKNKGRYLEIRKISKPFDLNDTLTLCEVQVFTSTKLSATKFCRTPRHKPMKALSTSIKGGKLQCSSVCNQYENCLGFELYLDDICNLYQTSQTVESNDTESYYFEKC